MYAEKLGWDHKKFIKVSCPCPHSPLPQYSELQWCHITIVEHQLLKCYCHLKSTVYTGTHPWWFVSCQTCLRFNDRYSALWCHAEQPGCVKNHLCSASVFRFHQFLSKVTFSSMPCNQNYVVHMQPFDIRSLLADVFL